MYFKSTVRRINLEWGPFFVSPSSYRDFGQAKKEKMRVQALIQEIIFK